MAKKKTRCKFCGFEWVCNSAYLYVSCPNCLRKTLRVKKDA